MKRVAVTGLGAVTPLGNDAPFDLARRGRRRERDRLHQVVRRERLPGPGRRRGQGLRSGRAREHEGGPPARPERPARARRRGRGQGRRGAERIRPVTRRRRLRFRDRRLPRDHGAERGPRRARAGSRLALLHPQRARRLGERPDRDLARNARAELRAGLGLRHRLTRRGRGRRDHPPRRCGHHPRRRNRGLHAPADPGRLLRDARARGRGGAPTAERRGRSTRHAQAS